MRSNQNKLWPSKTLPSDSDKCSIAGSSHQHFSDKSENYACCSSNRKHLQCNSAPSNTGSMFLHSVIVCLNEDLMTNGIPPHCWKPWLITSFSQASCLFQSIHRLKNNPTVVSSFLLLSWLLELTFFSVKGFLKLLSCLGMNFDLILCSQDHVFFLTALDPFCP